MPNDVQTPTFSSGSPRLGAERAASAPPHPAQDVLTAASGAGALVGAFRVRQAATRDGLPVARRAALDATARMVYPSERRAAVAAVLGLVAVPRARLLAPADGDVGLTADHDRVGQAADPIGHFATAVRTNGHDPPLLDVAADHLRPV